MFCLATHSKSENRHAGYAYSGPVAAWAYKTIDTTGMSVIPLFIFLVRKIIILVVNEFLFSDPPIIIMLMVVRFRGVQIMRHPSVNYAWMLTVRH